MHGGDIYRNSVRYDFSVNVNPLGMPASVRRALRRSLAQADRYPDSRCQELKNALTVRHGIAADRIVCGNGASELIAAVVRACSVQKALLVAPSFTGYRNALNAVDAQIITVPLWNDMPEELCRQLREQKPELCIIANPNNPDGSLLSLAALNTIADTCRTTGTTLLIDECFIELSDKGDAGSFIPCLTDYDNVLVLRAFTKSYALAGVRIGYAVATPELIMRVQAQLPEWNVSVLAQGAGIAAAKDTRWLQKTNRLVAKERAYLVRELEKLGCRVYPSHANFLLFQVPQVTQVSQNGNSGSPNLQKQLLQKGFLIRDCSDYDGLAAGYYRIAVKTHGENRKLIHAMSVLLEKANSGENR